MKGTTMMNCATCSGPMPDPDTITYAVRTHTWHHRSCLDLAEYNATVERQLLAAAERADARAQQADRYYPAGLLF